MSNLRLIARLDIKTNNLIKGVQMEGLRVVGDPQVYAHKYYEAGIDEILYVDTVASLYGRNNLTDIVSHTAQDVFIPITVGGGVRSVDDARKLLLAGADKVAINTAAINRPELISELAKHFGSQCIVLSVQAKQIGPGKWEAFCDNGRERTGVDVVEWAHRGQELGAGEILLTSVDREGTRKGFDIDLTASVVDVTRIPIIASGGMGSYDHLSDVVDKGGVDAVAMGRVLHYDEPGLAEIRRQAIENGIPVRHL